ncbi:MAG TPA: cupin domain-containing protein [Candidatus Acidoferrales bacterium]|nr:cupin domain-containing protein [Candidatus Acidoferrales bacterium]
MNAADWISALGLAPHPEGGYFRRTYASERRLETDGAEVRPLMTSIYYLLTREAPTGHLHRNRSDIVHFFHAGAPIVYWLVWPDGRLERHVLGPDPAQGHTLQLAVPGGVWKASRLEAGAYGLISEAVAPGFDAADRDMAGREEMRRLYPAHWPVLSTLIGDGAA